MMTEVLYEGEVGVILQNKLKEIKARGSLRRLLKDIKEVLFWGEAVIITIDICD